MASISQPKGSWEAKMIPAFIARTQLGQILKQTKNGGVRFVVERRGQPQAVILGVEDFLENFVSWPKSLLDLQAQAKRKGLNLLKERSVRLEVQRLKKAPSA